jgi:lipoprotein-releasing system permease protein
MTYEHFIGFRYLRSKQRPTFIALIALLSVAGVTVGVMALIVVIAVMAGFESDLKARILGVESHVVVVAQGQGQAGYKQVLRQVQAIDGVAAATPFVYSQVMIRSAYGVSGAVLRGVDPLLAGKVIQNLDTEALLAGDVEGPQQAEGKPSPVILGKELAKKLAAVKGGQVQIIAPTGILSPMGHLPAMKSFQVTGLFSSGMFEYDGSLAFVHLEQAQRLLRMPGAVSGIEIKVNDVYQAPQIARQIESMLGAGFWVRDWTQMNQNLFAALKLEKTVMFIILALIILVAAFNIASTLIMMVMQKTKDIAILKAMGATDRSIRKIFIFNGMAIGSLGIALGVSLGFVLCTLLKHYQFIHLPGDVYYITTLPVKLAWLDVVMIATAALLICFVSTLYPARQAARFNPVDAFRYG